MTRPQIIRFAVCVLAALVQGFVILKSQALGLWLLLIGIVGAIPFLLVNGVHGDAEGVAGVVGGVLFVLTNGAVYFAVVSFLLRLRRRRRERARSTAQG